MNRKSIIIAIFLLLMAGAIIIIRRNDARATTPDADHAAPQTGAGAPSKPPPASTVGVRDEALVARYGEAKTLQARKAAVVSINLFRNDLKMKTSPGRQRPTSSSKGTGKGLLLLLGFTNNHIMLSDEQIQTIGGLYKDYRKQSLQRADEVVKELESRPEDIMKLLLAADACTQGHGDLEEYNRLRAALDERLKYIGALPIKITLGLPNVWYRPIDDPGFHDEFVTLLDHEQAAALDMHLKEPAAKAQGNLNNDKIGPRRLEETQGLLDKMTKITDISEKLREASEDLNASGVGQ